MNKLILLRHGQSQWNLENRFTGWKDVPLTKNGEIEAMNAGLLMKRHKTKIDLIFSSVLQRANETARLAILQMNLHHLWQKNKKLIMIKNEALNERDYGELVGLNKHETADKYGKEQVHVWRRSYDVPPPGGESLKDVLTRVSPYFNNFIKPKIYMQKNVLIAAHGNSLRSLMIELGLYKIKEISKIEIPTGKPFIIYYRKEKIIKSEYLN